MTPDGKISKTLTGKPLELRKLKKYVFEAANGRKISSFEKMVMACRNNPEYK